MKKKFNIFSMMDNVITGTKVSEIMVTDIKTLNEKESVQKAIELMASFSISGLLIVDGKGYPAGIVSEGDIIKKVFIKSRNPNKVEVKEIMTPHLFTISPGQNLGETAEQMKKHSISKLPIVSGGKLVGYVTKSDLVEKINEMYYQNSRLKYLPIVMLIQLIAIAVLLALYLGK